MDDDRSWSNPVQVIKPLFDPVLACTYKQGFLLRGYEIWVEHGPGGSMEAREVRQIWYCVPVRKGPAANREPGAPSLPRPPSAA